MISLEELFTGDVIDRNFQKLRRLVPDTGGVSLGSRSGTVTVTFAGASAYTNTATVTHGLGKAPTSVQLTGQYAVGTDTDILVAALAGAPTSTTFDVVACYPKFAGTPTARNRTVHWRVEG